MNFLEIPGLDLAGFSHGEHIVSFFAFRWSDEYDSSEFEQFVVVRDHSVGWVVVDRNFMISVVRRVPIHRHISFTKVCNKTLYLVLQDHQLMSISLVGDLDGAATAASGPIDIRPSNPIRVFRGATINAIAISPSEAPDSLDNLAVLYHSGDYVILSSPPVISTRRERVRERVLGMKRNDVLDIFWLSPSRMAILTKRRIYLLSMPPDEHSQMSYTLPGKVLGHRSELSNRGRTVHLSVILSDRYMRIDIIKDFIEVVEQATFDVDDTVVDSTGRDALLLDMEEGRGTLLYRHHHYPIHTRISGSGVRLFPLFSSDSGAFLLFDGGDTTFFQFFPQSMRGLLESFRGMGSALWPHIVEYATENEPRTNDEEIEAYIKFLFSSEIYPIAQSVLAQRMEAWTLNSNYMRHIVSVTLRKRSRIELDISSETISRITRYAKGTGVYEDLVHFLLRISKSTIEATRRECAPILRRDPLSRDDIGQLEIWALSELEKRGGDFILGLKILCRLREYEQITQRISRLSENQRRVFSDYLVGFFRRAYFGEDSASGVQDSLAVRVFIFCCRKAVSRSLVGRVSLEDIERGLFDGIFGMPFEDVLSHYVPGEYDEIFRLYRTFLRRAPTSRTAQLRWQFLDYLLSYDKAVLNFRTLRYPEETFGLIQRVPEEYTARQRAFFLWKLGKSQESITVYVNELEDYKTILAGLRDKESPELWVQFWDILKRNSKVSREFFREVFNIADSDNRQYFRSYEEILEKTPEDLEISDNLALINFIETKRVDSALYDRAIATVSPHTRRRLQEVFEGRTGPRELHGNEVCGICGSKIDVYHDEFEYFFCGHLFHTACLESRTLSFGGGSGPTGASKGVGAQDSVLIKVTGASSVVPYNRQTGLVERSFSVESLNLEAYRIAYYDHETKARQKYMKSRRSRKRRAGKRSRLLGGAPESAFGDAVPSRGPGGEFFCVLCQQEGMD